MSINAMVTIYCQHGASRDSADYWSSGAWADINRDGIRSVWEQEATLIRLQAPWLERELRAQGVRVCRMGYGGFALAKSGEVVDPKLVAGLVDGQQVEGEAPLSQAQRHLAHRWWHKETHEDVIDLQKPRYYSTGHGIVNRWAHWWLVNNPGGASIVLCKHANAGGGDYASAFCLRGSDVGERALEPFAAPLAALPGVSRVRAWAAYDDVRDTASRPSMSPWLHRAHYCMRGAWAGPQRHTALLSEPGFVDQPKHASLFVGDGHRMVGEAEAKGLLAALEALGSVDL